jgi:tRNA A58 N-methylase Trm61
MYLKHTHIRQGAYDIKEIVEFLGINKEWDVADLGAGDGFFQKNLQRLLERSRHTILMTNISVKCKMTA